MSDEAAAPVRNVLDQLAELFAGQGAGDYLGEPVTQAQHMLQAADLARRAGASDELVAAALLHDVGHFRGVLTGRDLMEGVDNRHAESGARWLERSFGPPVTEPVRLHVAAKRYLCRCEESYLASLSEASRYTLAVQGGAMGPAEAASFELETFFADAVALRRFDEAAKDPARGDLRFEDFGSLLEGLSTSSRASNPFRLSRRSNTNERT